MKKLTSNKYANFYLNAADALGLHYETLNEQVGLARIFNGIKSLDISSNVLGVNTQLSASLSVNKVKTSILLKEANLPVPTYRTFVSQDKAILYAIKQLQNKKSVVVKPITGSLSFGITVNPANNIQIKHAVAEAFEGNSSIMIEEFINGKHFRITVLDDEVIAVTERIAANVTTDGKHTILELIVMKNKQRKKNALPAIILRKKDQNYLKKEKIILSKIYPEGISIILQLGCDLDIGGERRKIDREIIPQENINLFIKAAKALNLRFAGIDYISPDIMTSHTELVTAINEINSAPDSDVHYRDSFPYDNYAAERIVERIFKTKTNAKRKKLQAVTILKTMPTVTISNKNIQTN